jgi:hypothetical protein
VSSRPDRSMYAQLLAAAILATITLIAVFIGRRAVALHDLNDTNGTLITAAGAEVPEEAITKSGPNTPKPGEDFIWQRGRFFRGLIVGADNRWSTSKFQALVWTYAVVYALLALIFAKWMRNPSGFDALTSMKSNDWDVYLILLGGPFASFVLSKFITAAKVDQGDLDKTTASTSTLNPVQGVGEVLSKDSGQADLGDTQYVIFNLVVLIYFIGSFAANLSKGLPTLPAILVGLTSVSAATYVTKKAAEKAQPSVTSVVPTTLEAGKTVEVFGANLLAAPPSSPAPTDWKPRALVNGVTATVTATSNSGPSNRLTVEIPASTPAGAAKLVILTAVGTAAGEQEIQILPRASDNDDQT